MKKIFSLGIAVVSVVFLFGCSAFDEEKGNGFPGNNYGLSSSSYWYSNISSSSSISTVTLPSTPTGVTAMANSENSITVSWQAVSDANVYYIYRSTSSSSNYTQVGTSATNSYTDNFLSSSTTYYYKVAAYNNGIIGSQSNYIDATTYGSLIYGGQFYKTVIIGTQTWMTENLNYNVTGSVCYDNDSSNCTKYGRLYDWATAMNLPSSCNNSTTNSTTCRVDSKHRGICPSSWHIPSNEDWAILENYVGGSSTAGRYLKATIGWPSCGSSGSGNSYLCEDTYGFAALPGGAGFSGGSFNLISSYGRWWSASEGNANYAYNRDMIYEYGLVGTFSNNKSHLYSVRCVMD